MSHGPADDILRELGRIVWEAITLEDRVYQVAGHLSLDPDDDPVGTCIAKTIKKLGALGSHSELVEAIAWFEDARSALEDRNAVLHGIPRMSFESTADGSLAPTGATAIEYLGRRKAVGREVPLAVAELQHISARLGNVNARWQMVTISVSQVRAVPWGPAP